MSENIVTQAFRKLTKRTLRYVGDILGEDAQRRAIPDFEGGFVTIDGLSLRASWVGHEGEEGYHYARLRILSYHDYQVGRFIYTFCTPEELADQLDLMFENIAEEEGDSHE